MTNLPVNPGIKRLIFPLNELYQSVNKALVESTPRKETMERVIGIFNKIKIKHFNLLGGEEVNKINQKLTFLRVCLLRFKDSENSDLVISSIKAIDVFKSRINTTQPALEVLLPLLKNHQVPDRALEKIFLKLDDNGYSQVGNLIDRFSEETISNVKLGCIMTLETIIIRINKGLISLQAIGIRTTEGVMTLLQRARKTRLSVNFLDLSQITGVNDDVIEKMSKDLSKVESLNLAGCRRVKMVQYKTIFPHLMNLKRLDLSRCFFITKSAIIALSKLKNLKSLSLSLLHSLDRECMENLASLGQLTQLSLAKARLSGQDFTVLSNFTKLESLDLDGTNFDKIGLNSISKLKNLKTLCLVGTKVKPLDLRCLKDSRSSLEELRFAAGKGGESIQFLVKNFPNLKKLTLGNFEIQDGDLAFLTQLNNLEQLDISGCEKITDEGLRALLSCLKLRRVIANRCPRLSKQVLDVINKRLL